MRPGLVYLSHPTELGTLYTRAQLEDISRACREAGLLLYVDGARLYDRSDRSRQPMSDFMLGQDLMRGGVR